MTHCEGHELTMVDCGNAATQLASWRPTRLSRVRPLKVCQACADKLSHLEGDRFVVRKSLEQYQDLKRLLAALFLARVVADNELERQIRERAKLDRLLLEVIQDHLAGLDVLAKLFEASRVEFEVTGQGEAVALVIDALGMREAWQTYAGRRTEGGAA